MSPTQLVKNVPGAGCVPESAPERCISGEKKRNNMLLMPLFVLIAVSCASYCPVSCISGRSFGKICDQH